MQARRNTKRRLYMQPHPSSSSNSRRIPAFRQPTPLPLCSQKSGVTLASDEAAGLSVTERQEHDATSGKR